MQGSLKQEVVWDTTPSWDRPAALPDRAKTHSPAASLPEKDLESRLHPTSLHPFPALEPGVQLMLLEALLPSPLPVAMGKERPRGSL